MNLQRKAPRSQATGHSKVFSNNDTGFRCARQSANPVYPHRQDYWRERLPEADAYYRQRVKKLSKPNRKGWAQGCCPFHEDRQASLSVNLQHGGWRCFAGCGHGDLLAFHMRLTGKAFAQAVAELTGVQP